MLCMFHPGPGLLPVQEWGLSSSIRQDHPLYASVQGHEIQQVTVERHAKLLPYCAALLRITNFTDVSAPLEHTIKGSVSRKP